MSKHSPHHYKKAVAKEIRRSHLQEVKKKKRGKLPAIEGPLAYNLKETIQAWHAFKRKLQRPKLQGTKHTKRTTPGDKDLPSLAPHGHKTPMIRFMQDHQRGRRSA